MAAGEVRAKLALRAADASSVDAVLARLREYGYLDDARFAEAYSTIRRDSGNFGQARVVRDLRQRRVGAAVAEQAAAQAFDEVDETTLIEQWIERKLKNRNVAEFLADEKNLASTYRKLRYAGFSSSASIRVLKRHANKADELEDAPDVDTE